jgi:hypothetical protein
LRAPHIVENPGALKRVSGDLRADAVLIRKYDNVLERHLTTHIRLAPSCDRSLRNQELRGKGVRLHLDRVVLKASDSRDTIDHRRMAETVVRKLMGKREPLPGDGLSAIDKDQRAVLPRGVRAGDPCHELKDHDIRASPLLDERDEVRGGPSRRKSESCPRLARPLGAAI